MANYITYVEGDTYFAARLHADAWTDAIDGDKTKALTMATKIIDGLNYLGEKTADSQVNQFPRGEDAAVPQDIKDACAEIALKLLDDVDPDMESKLNSVQSNAFSSVKTTYNREFVPEYLVVGVPSFTAWKLLLPYLRDTQTITITRV
jgi:hypothetical protein